MFSKEFIIAAAILLFLIIVAVVALIISKKTHKPEKVRIIITLIISLLALILAGIFMYAITFSLLLNPLSELKN